MRILIKQINKYYDLPKNELLTDVDRAMLAVDCAANLFLNTIKDSIDDPKEQMKVLTHMYKSSMLHFEMSKKTKVSKSKLN